MLRTMGTKAGILTFVGDCLKCIAAVALVRFLFRDKYPDILPLLAFYTGAGVILGHNYPFYLGFRGGKGIAATAGLVIAFNPIMTVLGILTFFGVALTTHYVSLASMLTYLGILAELIILGQMGKFHMSGPHLAELYVVCFLLTVLAFWKHRENMKRLLNHTERKTYLKKRSS